MPLTAPEATFVEPGGLLARAGPFEASPQIAVAVSGGADSMALALEAARWARAHGGEATALIVDHGLRPGSAAEARRVAGWLDGLGIDRRILTWRGAKPRTGIQAAAREARYALLTSWCRRAGVLHLLVGHHLEDQAETFMLRLDRGSGVDGLAAMPAVVETPWLRILRPFLNRSRDDLEELLTAEHQEWIDDPSNDDGAFARVRARRALTALDAGREAGARLGRRLADTTRRLGHARVALERETSRLLAATVAIYPTGYAVADMDAIAAAPTDIGRRALSRIVTAIGGRAYAPRRERLERMHARVVEGRLGRGATLAGCLLTPGRAGVTVLREPQAIRERSPVGGPGEILWDGRFRVSVAPAGRSGLVIAALGSDGWSRISKDRPELRNIAIPARVRHGLPALWDGRRPICVPHLEYVSEWRRAAARVRCNAWFSPRHPLAGTEFSVV